MLELSSAAEASGVMVRVRGRLHGFEASKKDCSFQFIDCSWWSLPRDERRTVDASPLQFIDSSCWSSPVGFEREAYCGRVIPKPGDARFTDERRTVDASLLAVNKEGVRGERHSIEVRDRGASPLAVRETEKGLTCRADSQRNKMGPSSSNEGTEKAINIGEVDKRSTERRRSSGPNN